MSLPLFILAIGSIFVGYLGKDIFIGPGSSFFTHSIFVLPNHITLINAEFLHPFIKQIPVLASILGATVSIIVYSKSRIIDLKKYIYSYQINDILISFIITI